MSMTKCELKTKIQEYQFILVELNLYIETHPNDEAAITDYNTYSAKLCELIDMYDEEFEPLVGFGHSPMLAGSWPCSRWPWEN